MTVDYRLERWLRLYKLCSATDSLEALSEAPFVLDKLEDA